MELKTLLNALAHAADYKDEHDLEMYDSAIRRISYDFLQEVAEESNDSGLRHKAKIILKELKR